MRIVYTRHARKRMTQRKITPEQVEAVLTGPDEILPGDWDEEIAIKQFGTSVKRLSLFIRSFLNARKNIGGESHEDRIRPAG